MHQRKSGQMLIIMLLVMVVGLTIGLFLIGRTTTDVSLTSRTTDSARAFNAAEAGIEEAMRIGGTIITSSPIPVATGVSYTVTKTDLGASGIYPSTVQAATNINDAFTVWLVGHNADDTINDSDYYHGANIDVCFTENTTGRPALGVVFYFKDVLDGSIIKSSYFAIDSQLTARVPPNTFAKAVTTNLANRCTCLDPNGCYNYRYQLKINAASDFGTIPNNAIPYALRFKPIYYSTSIAVNPGTGNLPKQGNYVISTGNAGETSRKIQVEDPYRIPAPFMDNAIYSKSDLTK